MPELSAGGAGLAMGLNPAALSSLQGEAQKAQEKKAKNLRHGSLKGGIKSRFNEALREAGVSNFYGVFSKSLEENDHTLENLWDDIFSKGDALSNHPLLDEIREYRESVQRFLSYVVKFGFDVESRGLNERRRLIIEKVNEKLEKLASSILTGQAEQISILERLDEIKGLLVNLLAE
ncbi:MAG: YaaR family protein [Spirochaetaceae bacterium]|jgi:uncharacterized protein YaaR (DUF327 family)|nr:YaaR family protein [Spirochaetaceae bacterium]